jgi:hypothetical protein
MLMLTFQIGDAARRAANEGRLIGLLASQVDDTREFTPHGLPLVGRDAGGQVDLGPLWADGGGTLRLFDPDRFLPEAAWRQLFDLPREAAP